MVKKKRVTLPKDFGELVKAGDIENLRLVMKNVSFMHMMRVVREIQLFIIVMFLMSLFVGSQNKV